MYLTMRLHLERLANSRRAQRGSEVSPDHDRLRLWEYR